MTATSTPKVADAGPAARRAPASAGSERRAWHLRANAVVLGYVAAALLALLAHQSLPVPRWLAVHLLLLGAATNAIVTWSEHFAVALLRARAPSRRLAAGRLAALNAGVLGVLVGVTAGLAPVTVLAATVLAGVVVAHSVSLALVGRRALMGRFASTVRFYLLAGGFLVAGVVLGTVMVLEGPHAGGPHFADDVLHDRLHAAHVHANVLGWIGLSVLGTLFTLWPTVLRTRMVEGVMRDARRTLWLGACGTAVSVTGLAIGVEPLAVAGLVLYAAGVAVALRPFVLTWRRKAPTDPAAWSMAAAVLWLVASVVADVALLATAADLPSYLHRLDALVPALAVGFVLQVLLGALTYLVPVIRGGGPAGVRETIERLSPWWRVRVLTLNVGVLTVTVAAGVAAPAPVAVAGWALVGVAVAAFLVLVVGATTPEGTRGPLGGIALGLVMTLVPVLIAVSGHAPDAGPATVRVAAGSAVQQVAVSLVGMDIRPALIEVPAGTRLRLVVTNHDSMRHDLTFPGGPATPLLAPGQRATLDLGVVRRALSGWCTVAGHRAAGMTLDVRVAGGTGTATAAPAAAGAPGAMGAVGAASEPTFDVHGQPGAGWRPYDARLAPAPAATVHRVTLHVLEREEEIAPGVRQRMWTFGGTAPGPTLRGHVGDLFEVTLVNDGTMEHGIDFHAGENAPDRVMRALAPGQSLVYRFRADHSGAWLYHCSTMPMSQHVANGMYGAVVIDPPGLPTADREFVLVASQLYAGTRDGGADPARVAAGQWAAATFNGYPDQYVHAPLTAKVGERVRWWVVAAGPSDGVDFHVVGSQFDTVFKEGAYLLRPDNPQRGAAQVLDLDPAQGGFVEQVFREPGHYVLVDHDLRRGEAGARGVVEVTR